MALFLKQSHQSKTGYKYMIGHIDDNCCKDWSQSSQYPDNVIKLLHTPRSDYVINQVISYWPKQLLHQQGTTVLFRFRSLSTVVIPTESPMALQGPCVIFQYFQGIFNFQGLFKKALYIQVYFKPGWALFHPNILQINVIIQLTPRPIPLTSSQYGLTSSQYGLTSSQYRLTSDQTEVHAFLFINVITGNHNVILYYFSANQKWQWRVFWLQ